MSIRKIAKEIYYICCQVDHKIVGLSLIDSKCWAKENSYRHALAIDQILKYANSNNKDILKILNASGIACGHQDFSTVSYLRKYLSQPFTWAVYDSPNNPYLNKELFESSIKKLNINLRLSDLTKETSIYGPEDEKYDIILFTEIAEHLDHSIFLNTLTALRKKLNDDGILLFTTPNLLSLINRIRLVLGSTKGLYCGQGHLSKEKGLYGHIVLYDILRLKVLLADSGIQIINYFTFTDGYGPVEKNIFKHTILKIAKLLSSFIKDTKERIFIIAKRGDYEKIPIKI